MNSLLLWQLSDSAFPSGGFTHSGGLEAALQFGDIANGADVSRSATAAIRQAGYGALPFVLAAHRGSATLTDLDARADLFLNQPVSNRASCAQGRALISTATRVFPDAPLQ